MGSLIIDLQKDILNNEDIKTILNKALMISNELNLKEFNEWINLELNGYGDMDNLPSYRILECELRANLIDQTGFNIVTASNVPISNIPEDIYKQLMEIHINQSIFDLINICNENQDYVHFTIDLNIENLLKEYYVNNAIEIHRVCPIFKLETIIEQVKKEIMIWCSELKKNGIFGESYMFTVEEQERVKAINPIILSNSSIYIQNNFIQINNSEKKDILFHLNAIKEILHDENIKKEYVDEINEKMGIIDNELKKDNPDIKIMTDNINFLKEFVTQLLANVIANILIQHFDSILSILSNIQLPM